MKREEKQVMGFLAFVAVCLFVAGIFVGEVIELSRADDATESTPEPQDEHEPEPQQRLCMAGFPTLQNPVILQLGYLSDIGNGKFCCCDSLNPSSTGCLCEGEIRVSS